MPTDPTPTPREVLAKALATAFNLGAFYRETGGTGVAAPNYDVEPAEVDRVLAALAATGDAPLTEAVMTRIAGWLDRGDGHEEIWCDECGGEVAHEDDCPVLLCKRLLASYTTLAAQLAAARAERDALRGQVDEWDGVREHVRFLADATEANSVVEAYERDGVDFKDIDGHLQRDKEVVAAVRAVLARTGSPTPARPTDTGRDG
jgi:hypothetical protein